MGTSGSSSPPWQVLVLVANHLDPKILAIASCVSKSWFISMSSDHLWQPICSTHFPSLSTLHFADSTVPYHHLYALGRISAKRRLQKPRKPHLSLNNLMFTIDVHNNNSRVFTVLKLGAELKTDPNDMFRFDIDVDGEKILVGDDDLGGLRLAWNVVLEGYKGVFTMMECRGRGSDGWWFSEELPSPGCCSGVGTSGLVADLRLGLGLGGKGESACWEDGGGEGGVGCVEHSELEIREC
ncbi:probable F-box protein At5g04010 [Camellia sinensis]|uniref:probable F-box protein At5g04010 n=1 Tax=Camellia sinensis TaxID=4442 RepID=UPI00103591A5|nr:probable F-box protein At5g04010 [Camellia sinensis]